MLTYLALLCSCLALCYGQTCPSPTQYYEATNMTCIECPVTGLDPKCATAQCSDPTNTTCYSCKAGYQLDVAKACNAICAIAGTYYNTTTMSCDSCPKPTNCGTYNCDEPTEVVCVACDDGFLIKDGVCDTNCPPIDNCAKTRCTNSTNICVTCTFPWSLDAQLTCTSGGPANCTAAQYLNTVTNVCVDCSLPSNCATGAQRCTADSPTNVTCSQCATGFALDATGACIVSTCADNQYLDVVTNLCTDCPSPANCNNQTCQSATQVTCISCATGYVLGTDGVCALPGACSSTQFLDPVTNLCVDCAFPSMCLTGTCRSTTDVTCTACVPFYVVISNVCQPVPTCLPTQYLDAVNNVCVDCVFPTNCFSYSCTGPSDSVCSICNTGFFLDPATNTCIARLECNSMQYRDPTSDECISCPFQPSGSCAVGTCTSPSDALCSVCNSGYTVLPTGICQPVISGNTPCNLCPASGTSTGCPAGALCCGCSTTGTGRCALTCDDDCTELICPSETSCGTPSGCQTRGGCQVITTGTCATCFIGFEGVPDGAVGLYRNCDPVGFRSCDTCNPDNEGCPAGQSCCCGTCREFCSIKCGEPDCENRMQETAQVVTQHSVGTNCDDNNNLDVIKDMIRAHVSYTLGAWLQSDGSASYQFDCSNTGKRQSGSSLLVSDISLSGINAQFQAQILADNFINNGTGNGVWASLESVEADGGSGGLSGGAIAGIVIGAIVGFILVVVIVYVVVTKQGENVESV